MGQPPAATREREGEAPRVALRWVIMMVLPLRTMPWPSFLVLSARTVAVRRREKSTDQACETSNGTRAGVIVLLHVLDGRNLYSTEQRVQASERRASQPTARVKEYPLVRQLPISNDAGRVV